MVRQASIVSGMARQVRQDRRRLGISRYERVRRVVLRIGALRSGKAGVVFFVPVSRGMLRYE